jgi:hypothetical protein
MNRMLTVYLDTCCYSRLFDVTTQDSVIKEAVRMWARDGRWEVVSYPSFSPLFVPCVSKVSFKESLKPCPRPESNRHGS